MTMTELIVRWRAIGPYTPNASSKTGLLDETRRYLEVYGQCSSLVETRRRLLDGELLQRSRQTRDTIIQTIQQRLTRWSPPGWVLSDLVIFAEEVGQPSLASALLLHVARQDVLLYDFVQQVVVPHWRGGQHTLIRADVQRFLDLSVPEHPEIDGWTHATREKLAGNVLSILRDYGLLRGREQKQIVAPIVPLPVAAHLARLLQTEGISPEDLPNHSDWRIWLWDPQQVRSALSALNVREAVAWPI